MQEVPDTHAAAIGSSDRVPVVDVEVDWDGSGDPAQPYGRYTVTATDAVVSVSVDRSYATSLPQEITYLQGNAVSSARVQLAGDPAMDLSPFRSGSPLSSGRRMGRPVVVRAGMSGHDPVTLFTGSVRSSNPRSADRTADLEFLDLPVEWRAAPVLPVAAGGGGWLNGQWYIDEMLRQAGVHTSPPPLAGCAFALSMHGSANPQVGALADGQYIFDPFIESPFAPGVFGMAYRGPVLPVENRLFFARYNLDGDRPRFSSFMTQQVQFWAETPYEGGAPPGYLFRLGITDNDAEGYFDVNVLTNGALKVDLQRKGQPVSSAVSGFPPTPARWRYYGVHITWSATTATVLLNVGGVVSTHELYVGPHVSTTISTNTPLARVDLHAGSAVPFESVQVTLNQPPDWSQAPWVPEAQLEVSKLWLDATPPVEYATRWEVVTALAEAEFATVEHDEQGVFRYRTSDRWAQVAQPVGEITADSDLMDLVATESVDAVRNQIRVSRTILSTDPVDWHPSANPTFTTAIAPNSEYSFVYDFERPILAASFVGPLSGGYVLVGTAEFGNSTEDDGGGAPGALRARAVVQLLGKTAVKVTIRNATRYFRYLANNAILQGTVFASAVDQEAGVAEDAGSIGDYGLRPYQLPDSPWRQSQTSADLIAADLLAQLKQPLPILEDVPVVGDPRRQLGDRLTVVERDGLGVLRDYWTIGVRSQFAAGAFTQSLTLRPCADPIIVTPPDPGGGGGPVFDPSSIPGIYRWWTAEDLTGADGAAVTSWVDRVVGARATQSVITSQPRFRASAFGGKPALQFDGVADYLSASVSLGPAYTIAVVGRSLMTPTPGQSAGFLSADGDGEKSRLFQLRLVAANRVEFISFTQGAYTTTYISGDPYGYYQQTYSTNPIYAYGSRTVPSGAGVSLIGVRSATEARASLLGATEGPAAAPSGAKITRAMAIGRTYGPPNVIASGAGFLNGFIAAVYIWPRDLTLTEQATLTTGLASLHNLPT